MKAYSRDSKYISENFEQEEGDGDWITQTSKIETTLEKISVYSDTTTAQIVTYDKDSVAIEIGDKLLVDDGGVWKEITVEGVTDSPGAGTISYNADFSYTGAVNTSPVYLALGYVPGSTLYNSGSASFSLDGLRCWMTTPGASALTLVQFDLSTPYNLNTIIATNSFPYPYAAGNSGGNGFFFANKGKYLFTNDTVNGQYLRRYLLATPYDITTASRPSQQYNPSASAGTSWSFLNGAFNDDGTKFMVKSLTTMYYGTTTIPFNISYASGVYTYGNISNTLSFTHDGKYMVELFDDTNSVSAAYLKVYDMSNDPCNLSTAAVTSTYMTFAAPVSWFSTSNNTYSKLIISQNLKHITVIPWTYHQQAFHALTTTLGTKTTIDISTQELVNPPTDGNVYLATRPTLKIAASPRTEAFTYNQQLVHTGTTTTASKIHYEKSGLLAAGDTVLFDNVNLVQLTSVTETTSDATITNSMKYVGQYATGKLMINNHNEGGWGPHFQLSTDGKRLFVLQGAYTSGTSYNAGIYIYDLSIPWDISTATLSGVNENRHIFDWANLMTIDNSSTLPAYNVAAGPVFGSTGQYNSCGFQFSPDGTKLTVGLVLSTGVPILRVITFTLLVPWNLFSIISVTYPAVGYTGLSSTTTFWRDIFFNTDGSQLILVNDVNSYTSTDLRYHPYPTSTPWVGASAIPSTAADTSSMIALNSGSTARLITRFTPDGKRLISLGQGGISAGDISNAQYVDLAANSYNNISSAGWPASGSWVNFFAQSWWPSSITSNFTGQVADHRFSPDGKRWYIMMDNGTIHQIDGNFNVDPGVMYNITYPTQSVAPTTIHIPDQSIEQSLTFGTPTSINSSYGNVTYTGSQENISGSRSVRFELDGPTSIDFQVDTVRIDLEKGA